MATIADFLNARPQLQRRLFFLARRFVPGETIENAITAVRALNADKLSATLDFLGEDVFNEADAAHTTDTYIEMIDAIGHAGVDSNVSVKQRADQSKPVLIQTRCANRHTCAGPARRLEPSRGSAP